MSEERITRPSMDDVERGRHERAAVHERSEIYREPALIQKHPESAAGEICPNSRLSYRFAKRAFDLIVSSLGLIVLSPVFLILAIVIKLEDPKGKVFYIAPRGGLHNIPFPCYKFRSMQSNADEIKDSLKSKNIMNGPVFKIPEDPRLTRVGRVLRKTSLDELAQLLNVFRGEMSLVGPRPLPTVEANAVTGIGKARELVKPGITCIWQVSGRNNVDFDEWMRMDAEYVENQSFWLDIKLLLKTIPAVLSRDGAS